MPSVTDSFPSQIGMEPDDSPSSTRSLPVSRSSPTSLRLFLQRSSLREISNKLQPLVHRSKTFNLGCSIDQQPSAILGEDDKHPSPPPRRNRPNTMAQPAVCSTESEQSVVERIEVVLHDNYYVIAYSLVVVAYLVGFAEYIYLRLLSILAPDKTIYHPSCVEKEKLRVGKDGFHYGVSIAAFLAIALFQLICFFGLTISENWTKYEFDCDGDDQIRRKRTEVANKIKILITQTMYRVFVCYGICSFINCGIIFYMVGIQDSLGDTVSTILQYVFDAVVILYFIAFPLTTIIYHPNVQCFRSPGLQSPLPIVPPQPRSQNSTLESTVSGLEQYMHSPRRLFRTTTVV